MNAATVFRWMCVLLPLLIAGVRWASAQTRAADSVFVGNVHFETSDAEVRIFYDLVVLRDSGKSKALQNIISSMNAGKSSSDDDKRAMGEVMASINEDARAVRSNREFRVSVVLRKEGDEFFRYQPRKLSGDVGLGRFAGRNKQITWDWAKEFPNGFDGNDYFFEVQAEPVIRQDNTLLYWLGGGAAVIGGSIITYLMLSGNDGSSQHGDGFPMPPSRPR